jgi:hypothetical protein
MRTSGKRFAAHGAPFFAMPSRICVAQRAVDVGGRDDLTIAVALGVMSGHVGTGEDKSVTVLTYDHEILAHGANCVKGIPDCFYQVGNAAA